MSWIPCTEPCLYQQEGYCTLDKADDPPPQPAIIVAAIAAQINTLTIFLFIIETSLCILANLSWLWSNITLQRERLIRTSF